MTISDFSKSNTILVRHSMNDIKFGGGRAIIDLDKNESLRVESKTGVFLEPVLDMSLEQLKEFAKTNGQGPVLTKESLGELKTLKGDVDYYVALKKAGPDLTTVAKNLNPFKGRPDADKVQWAIDVQPDSKWAGEFVVYVPKT